MSCSIILLLFIEAEEAANMYIVLSDNVSLYQRKWYFLSLEGNVHRIAGKFNLGYLTSVDKCRLSLSWQIIWLKCDKVVFIFLI